MIGCGLVRWFALLEKSQISNLKFKIQNSSATAQENKMFPEFAIVNGYEKTQIREARNENLPFRISPSALKPLNPKTAEE